MYKFQSFGYEVNSSFGNDPIEAGIPEWLYHWGKSCIGEGNIFAIPIGEETEVNLTHKAYVTNPYCFSGVDTNEELREYVKNDVVGKEPMGIVWIGRDVAVVTFEDPKRSLLTNDPALIGKYPQW